MKLTIISDKGSPMMVVQKVKRKDDTLEITGQLMGAWPSKMYITVDEFKNVFGLILNLEVIVYLLLYPYFWAREKFSHKEQVEK
jgi:hypothetical protein